ncbi:ABC transporter ATP-binding protein, partial [Kocuria sp. CPCC 205300]|uniref:ABC transporter ATP-binding protein n=1 Tax=Kocuria sabuli TaxID=3071448 RepID=UPI0036DF56A8
FLMDEPLSNLDAKLRVQTRTQIASLTRRLGVTTVYVTHDQVEAMTMGDRVAVLKDGHLMQVDTPRNLYDRPATEFVAGFIGSPAMNLFRAPVTGDTVQLGTVRIPLTREQQQALTGGKVTIGIRPEDLHPAGEGTGLPIVADVVEELGADAFVYGHLAPVTAANTVVPVDATTGGEEDPEAHEFIVRVEGRTPPKAETTIWVAPTLEHVHLFDAATGTRLPD